MFQFVLNYFNGTRQHINIIKEEEQDKSIIKEEQDKSTIKEEHITIYKTPKIFCSWGHKDDIFKYLNVDEVDNLNIKLQDSFIYNKHLDDKYNLLLGIRECDTDNSDNYKELSDLYNNGLTINRDNLNLCSQIHPIIQSADSSNIYISPRLKTYFNDTIRCFYLEDIIAPKIRYKDNFDYFSYFDCYNYTHIFELDSILK